MGTDLSVKLCMLNGTFAVSYNLFLTGTILVVQVDCLSILLLAYL